MMLSRAVTASTIKPALYHGKKIQLHTCIHTEASSSLSFTQREKKETRGVESGCCGYSLKTDDAKTVMNKDSANTG